MQCSDKAKAWVQHLAQQNPNQQILLPCASLSLQQEEGDVTLLNSIESKKRHVYSFLYWNKTNKDINTHLTPIIWTSSSLAHSKRCLQFFSVVPNFMLLSSPPISSSVAICSKTLREGEDDWGRVGLHHHQHMWSLKIVGSVLIMLPVFPNPAMDGWIKWT